MTWKWEFVSGGEIEDTYIRQASLHDLVPDCEAIYLWRRELSAPGSALRDGTAFTRWLDSTMQVPTGEVCGQPLSHFVMLDQLTIQGRGLTPEKRRQLASFTNRPTARRWLARYIRSLSQFSPPLYCGETSDLVQRTRDHVGGETGFGQRVQQNKAPPWRELELAYYVLSDSRNDDDLRAKQRRTLLEVVTTSFAVAGYVARRG